jgi:hypothetical protein
MSGTHKGIISETLTAARRAKRFDMQWVCAMYTEEITWGGKETLEQTTRPYYCFLAAFVRGGSKRDLLLC